MVRFRRLVILAAAASALVGASCSDESGDTLERACRVIVEDCDSGRSMSDCIDGMGTLPPECLDCIAEADCGYATCQRTPACRIPEEFLGDE